MNLSDKVVYCYIKSRFDFFKSLGKEYFDTQQSIANFCNMDLKATGNILRKFIKNDLTTIYKKPYNNYQKNVYTYVGNLSLYNKYKDGKVVKHQTVVDDYNIVEDPPEGFLLSLPDSAYEDVLADLNESDVEWEY